MDAADRHSGHGRRPRHARRRLSRAGRGRRERVRRAGRDLPAGRSQDRRSRLAAAAPPELSCPRGHSRSGCRRRRRRHSGRSGPDRNRREADAGSLSRSAGEEPGARWLERGRQGDRLGRWRRASAFGGARGGQENDRGRQRHRAHALQVGRRPRQVAGHGLRLFGLRLVRARRRGSAFRAACFGPADVVGRLTRSNSRRVYQVLAKRDRSGIRSAIRRARHHAPRRPTRSQKSAPAQAPCARTPPSGRRRP